MDSNELRKLIETTLGKLACLPSYSTINRKEAVDLLMGTCAQESHLGTYRRQLGGGPALGIFQMEPNTFNDILNNYLKARTPLRDKILEISSLKEFSPEDLVDNDILAICMARVHYLRKPDSIPASLDGQAEYWKKHYNTYLGKGTVEEYKANYKRWVK